MLTESTHSLLTSFTDNLYFLNKFILAPLRHNVNILYERPLNDLCLNQIQIEMQRSDNRHSKNNILISQVDFVFTE